MDFEIEKRIGQGAEAMLEQMAPDPDGWSEYPLSDAVKAQLKGLEGLSDKDKLGAFNESVAEIRKMSGDIRKLVLPDGTIEIPGLGTYRFEFNGRRKTGKDGHDEDVSLRISRDFPRQNCRSPRTRAIFQRIIDREAPIIKNSSRKLNLRKRQRLPQNGHFVSLLDAHETVKSMHKALGLGKKNKQPKSKQRKG